ncbi:SDR family NAD(P)-dependent oxidoreductase [Afifella sp. IM 167]|uniref:SDR family NAD(P)-dependent oxidoreductase n=1 Tax=Afifella sp. IM 167 TaxID=2033586 RepID=UPI001CCBCCB5|nr:SDR family oxidoreductase [Afifella sp. IM 167]MBZ8134362.1 gluconate 5-dehydrogenase [Afifella sp. IM 167]
MTALASLFSLSGRHALVTGGSAGLGAEMARALASAGAAVTLVARRAERLEEICAAIADGGGEAHALAADLSAPDGVEELAGTLRERGVEPDILVNAAGTNLRQKAGEVTRESWAATLDLNLAVPFFLAQALVPAMARKGRGRVVNIASLQSKRAFADSVPYGASKGGVVQLTRAMAEAWSGQGITCNAIAPGLFPTELTRGLYDNAELVAQMAARTCVGRNGELSDIHGLAIYLASDASAFMTGQTLYLDGGLTAR